MRDDEGDKSETVDNCNKGDKSYHFVVLVVAILTIGMSFFLSIKGKGVIIPIGAGFESPDICVFKGVTGVNCPTCGLTRSFVSISHGDLKNSFSFNIAGFLVYLYVIFQIPYRFVMYKRKLQLEEPITITRINKIFTIITTIVLVISWGAYLLQRFVIL